MEPLKISATEARNKFFELIEIVAYKGYPVIVSKNNKELVRIVAERKPGSDLLTTDELIRQTFGICPQKTWPYEQKNIARKEKQANAGW